MRTLYRNELRKFAHDVCLHFTAKESLRIAALGTLCGSMRKAIIAREARQTLPPGETPSASAVVA